MIYILIAFLILCNFLVHIDEISLKVYDGNILSKPFVNFLEHPYIPRPSIIIFCVLLWMFISLFVNNWMRYVSYLLVTFTMIFNVLALEDVTSFYIINIRYEVPLMLKEFYFFNEMEDALKVNAPLFETNKELVYEVIINNLESVDLSRLNSEQILELAFQFFLTTEAKFSPLVAANPFSVLLAIAYYCATLIVYTNIEIKPCILHFYI